MGGCVCAPGIIVVGPQPTFFWVWMAYGITFCITLNWLLYTDMMIVIAAPISFSITSLLPGNFYQVVLFKKKKKTPSGTSIEEVSSTTISCILHRYFWYLFRHCYRGSRHCYHRSGLNVIVFMFPKP